jgi:hypothetical protein
MFTLETSFKPLLLSGGGGGDREVRVESVVDVTVNSEEENS